MPTVPCPPVTAHHTWVGWPSMSRSCVVASATSTSSGQQGSSVLGARCHSMSSQISEVFWCFLSSFCTCAAAHLPFATAVLSAQSWVWGTSGLPLWHSRHSKAGYLWTLGGVQYLAGRTLGCKVPGGRYILRPHGQPSAWEGQLKARHLTHFSYYFSCSDGWSGTLASPWVLMPNATRIYPGISSLTVRKEWTLFSTTPKRKSARTKTLSSSSSGRG